MPTQKQFRCSCNFSWLRSVHLLALFVDLKVGCRESSLVWNLDCRNDRQLLAGSLKV